MSVTAAAAAAAAAAYCILIPAGRPGAALTMQCCSVIGYIPLRVYLSDSGNADHKQGCNNASN